METRNRILWLPPFHFIKIKAFTEHNSSAWPSLHITGGNDYTYGKIANVFRRKYGRKVGNPAYACKIAGDVCRFVYLNMKYDDMGIESDEEILYTGRGVCTDYTIMAVTILKRLGINCEMMIYDVGHGETHMIFKVGNVQFDPVVNDAYYCGEYNKPFRNSIHV